MTTISPAPEWALIPTEGKARAAGGSVNAWLDRTIPGKPTKAVRKVEAKVTRQGMTHESMLEAATAIVRLGGERGAGEAAQRMRSTYTADWPGYERHWDNALEGSIAEFGLPPVTFPFTKAERKALRERAKPSVREAVALPSSGPADLTDDLALAGVVAETFRATLAFVGGGWREWDGARWGDVSHDHVLELVRLDHLARSAEAFHANNRRLYERFGRRTTATSTAGLIRGILERRSEEFDAHPDLLNVANGIVDLRTAELRPHDPEMLFTKIARGEFKPGATHPDWELALEALPDDVRPWVQVRAGQAATGHTPDDKKAVFFKGGGDNGKSSVVTPVQKVLGDYAQMAPERLLLASTGEMPLEIAGLKAARLVLAEELPEDHRIRSKRLKDLLGTETLTGRQLYRDYVSFRPSHSLWVTSNYPLRIAETDRGTWSRIAIVQFPFTYSMRPAAGELQAKPRLRADLEAGRGGRDAAVLAWIVEGARRWYAAGMVLPQPPEQVLRDTESLREDIDPIMGFAAERLEFSQDARVTSTEMAEAFSRWLFNNGHQAWSHQLISSRLESHDLFTSKAVRLDRTRIDGKQVRAWTGVSLRPNEAVLNSFVTQSSNR